MTRKKMDCLSFWGNGKTVLSS